MSKGVLRWIFILLCLLVVGPIVYRLTSGLRDVDGGHAATLLLAESLPKGLLAGAVTLLAAAVAGAVGSYLFSLSTGFSCAGVILAWGAWGLGTIDAIIRRSHGAGDLPKLAAEGGVVTAAALVMSVAMVVIARRRQPKPIDAPGGVLGLLGEPTADKPLQGGVIAGLVASLIGAAIGIWVMPVITLHGQTLMTVVVAGILAGVVGQFTASSQGVTITPVTPTLTLLLLAVAGPVIARLMGTNEHVVELAYQQQLLPLARPVSLDWAAGALLGTPIGIGWAGAMMDARHTP